MTWALRAAVRRTGLDGLTFHGLRDTYASLIAAGVGPMIIAEQMGHAEARLVLQRYGDLYPGASAQAAMALDLYLKAASAGQVLGEGATHTEQGAEVPLDMPR